MVKPEAVTTYTFGTQGSPILVLSYRNDRYQGATLQFPGSGNTAKKIATITLRELSEVSGAAIKFLAEHGDIVAAEGYDPNEGQIG